MLDAVLQLEEQFIEQLLSAASYLQMDSIMDACSQVTLVTARFATTLQSSFGHTMTKLMQVCDAVPGAQRVLSRPMHLDHDAC